MSATGHECEESVTKSWWCCSRKPPTGLTNDKERTHKLGEAANSP